MRSTIPAALVAGALVLLAGVVAWSHLGSGASAGPGESPSFELLESRLVELGQRVEALDTRLGGLEATVSGLRAVRSAATAEAAQTKEVETAKPEDAGGAAREGEAADPIASAFGGNAHRFRELVQAAVREERSERHARDREAMKRRAQETQELAQGPYGKYNLKVNAMAKKLGLNELQKQRHHALLQDYDQRLSELQKSVDWKSVDSRKSFRDGRRTLQNDYEQLFVQALSPEQAEGFKALPPFERNPQSGIGIVSAVLNDDEGGGDTIVEFEADGPEFILGGEPGDLPPPEALGLPLPGGEDGAEAKILIREKLEETKEP